MPAFDVIVAADVLEHLKDPGRCLQACLESSTPGARWCCRSPTSPTSTFASRCCRADFEYRPLGLLDETHLRFFTRASLEQFLADNRLIALEWDRVAGRGRGQRDPLGPRRRLRRPAVGHRPAGLRTPTSSCSGPPLHPMGATCGRWPGQRDDAELDELGELGALAAPSGRARVRHGGGWRARAASRYRGRAGGAAARAGQITSWRARRATRPASSSWPACRTSWSRCDAPRATGSATHCSHRSSALGASLRAWTASRPLSRDEPPLPRRWSPSVRPGSGRMRSSRSWSGGLSAYHGTPARGRHGRPTWVTCPFGRSRWTSSVTTSLIATATRPGVRPTPGGAATSSPAWSGPLPASVADLQVERVPRRRATESSGGRRAARARLPSVSPSSCRDPPSGGHRHGDLQPDPSGSSRPRSSRSGRRPTSRGAASSVDDGSSPVERSSDIRRVLGDDPRFVLVEHDERVGFYRNFERALALVPARRAVRRAGRPGRPLASGEAVRAGASCSTGDDAMQLVASDARLVTPDGERAGADVLRGTACPPTTTRTASSSSTASSARRCCSGATCWTGPALSAGVRGRVPRPLAGPGGAGPRHRRVRGRAAVRLRPARRQRAREPDRAALADARAGQAVPTLPVRRSRPPAAGRLGRPLPDQRAGAAADGRAGRVPAGRRPRARLAGPHRGRTRRYSRDRAGPASTTARESSEQPAAAGGRGARPVRRAGLGDGAPTHAADATTR